MASTTQPEIARQQRATSAVWVLFQQRPMIWLHWRRFADLAPCAWRTRISDARKQAKTLGGVIEWNRSVTRSAYRYLPYTPLGRDASIPATESWPSFDAPIQETFTLTGDWAELDTKAKRLGLWTGQAGVIVVGLGVALMGLLALLSIVCFSVRVLNQTDVGDVGWQTVQIERIVLAGEFALGVACVGYGLYYVCWGGRLWFGILLLLCGPVLIGHSTYRLLSAAVSAPVSLPRGSGDAA